MLLSHISKFFELNLSHISDLYGKAFSFLSCIVSLLPVTVSMVVFSDLSTPDKVRSNELLEHLYECKWYPFNEVRISRPCLRLKSEPNYLVIIRSYQRNLIAKTIERNELQILYPEVSSNLSCCLCQTFWIPVCNNDTSIYYLLTDRKMKPYLFAKSSR